MPLREAEMNSSVPNVGAETSLVNGAAEYLSDLSPKHKPWDQHRAESDEIEMIYGASIVKRHQRYSERVQLCSQVLEFARDPPAGGKSKLKLKAAWFCRVRFCPVCQWRRSMQWQARLYQALPRLLTDYPNARFLFATFTIRNCVVSALRYTLKLLTQGWKRLTELALWPAIGWIRAVEITRGKDGSAHPHLHSLLMVAPSYFEEGYLQQHEWAEMWRQSLRLTYIPIVDVRAIKQNTKRSSLKVNNVNVSHMWFIVTEILKYSVKSSDMIRDHAWFLSMSDQVVKTRAVAVGGVLKPYLKERGREDLTKEPAEDEALAEAERLFFGWKPQVKRYRKIGEGNGRNHTTLNHG
jgi:plasmid rolling circle replication initiator protein Rep